MSLEISSASFNSASEAPKEPRSFLGSLAYKVNQCVASFVAAVSIFCHFEKGAMAGYKEDLGSIKQKLKISKLDLKNNEVARVVNFVSDSTVEFKTIEDRIKNLDKALSDTERSSQLFALEGHLLATIPKTPEEFVEAVDKMRGTVYAVVDGDVNKDGNERFVSYQNGVKVDVNRSHYICSKILEAAYKENMGDRYLKASERAYHQAIGDDETSLEETGKKLERAGKKLGEDIKNGMQLKIVDPKDKACNRLTVLILIFSVACASSLISYVNAELQEEEKMNPDEIVTTMFDSFVTTGLFAEEDRYEFKQEAERALLWGYTSVYPLTDLPSSNNDDLKVSLKDDVKGVEPQKSMFSILSDRYNQYKNHTLEKKKERTKKSNEELARHTEALSPLVALQDQYIKTNRELIFDKLDPKLVSFQKRDKITSSEIYSFCVISDGGEEWILKAKADLASMEKELKKKEAALGGDRAYVPSFTHASETERVTFSELRNSFRENRNKIAELKRVTALLDRRIAAYESRDRKIADKINKANSDKLLPGIDNDYSEGSDISGFDMYSEGDGTSSEALSEGSDTPKLPLPSSFDVKLKENTPIFTNKSFLNESSLGQGADAFLDSMYAELKFDFKEVAKRADAFLDSMYAELKFDFKEVACEQLEASNAEKKKLVGALLKDAQDSLDAFSEDHPRGKKVVRAPQPQVETVEKEPESLEEKRYLKAKQMERKLENFERNLAEFEKTIPEERSFPYLRKSKF